MAEITNFGIFRHLRADASSHILTYQGAKLVREGRGLSFTFMPHHVSIAEIPIDDRELPILFHGRSADFQDVTAQGVSPPMTGSTKITDITEHQGPTRWRRDTRAPCPRWSMAREARSAAAGSRTSRWRRQGSQLADGRYPFPSKMKRSDRSVRRSAMIWALSASGKTLGQSLKGRLVVMRVDRRCS